MTILHLATLLRGGTGRVVVDLALEQHRAGHDVRVMTSEPGSAREGHYEAYLTELTRAGIPVRQVESLTQRSHAANLNVVKALLDWYGSGREPQVIHSHAAVPAIAGLLFAGARRLTAAQVLTMHEWGAVVSADQVATDVAVLNLMDRVAAPSRHTVDTLVSLGVSPARLAMVPYGVRPEGTPFDDRDAELLVDMTRARRLGALVVACVGTIEPRRNQMVVIDAIARQPDLPLLCVFIGDGDTEALQAAAAAAGVAHRVRIHGYSRAARRLAASAELLVLPSRSQGQPLSAIEAFCDGTLVAASDTPEFAELIPDDTGFRFDPGSAEALAETFAMVASLPNSTRRAIRQHARSQYQARFTVEAMSQEYFALYASATARTGQTGGTTRQGTRKAGRRQSSVA